MSSSSRPTRERRTPFFESRMGKAMLDKNQTRAARRSRADRRLAEKAGMINLPQPIDMTLPIEFDPSEALFLLGDEFVYVDRSSQGGYQRDYDDSRAREYGSHFDWGLYGRPLLNRREDGSLWVIAGQHRLAAAAYAGHTSVPVLIYNGLSLQQEAYLFNQEATRKRDLTALDKFHSGVQARYPDHLAVLSVVESLGGYIAQKSAPRKGGATYGIVATNELLNIYDYAGEKILYESLRIIRDAYGSLTGRGIDAALYSAVALMVGIFCENSEYGTVKREKLIEKLARTDPVVLRGRAEMYASRGKVAARFHALIDLYNYKTQQQNQLEEVRPDWRKIYSRTCTAPGCASGQNGRPGRTYRRNLCRRHYDEIRAGEDVMVAR